VRCSEFCFSDLPRSLPLSVVTEEAIGDPVSDGTAIVTRGAAGTAVVGPGHVDTGETVDGGLARRGLTATAGTAVSNTGTTFAGGGSSTGITAGPLVKEQSALVTTGTTNSSSLRHWLRSRDIERSLSLFRHSLFPSYIIITSPGSWLL
jgi:hypothetical protein